MSPVTPLKIEDTDSKQLYLPVPSISSPGSSSDEDDRTAGRATAKQKREMMMGHKDDQSIIKVHSDFSLSKISSVVKAKTAASDSSEEDSTYIRNTIQKPYRHANTERKTIDWSLSIHKPIIFIGDSNLSRIPIIKDKNIQVDSFPGANFLHIAKVLKKLKSYPQTEKVILAVGINNRQQHPRKTAIKQLQGLWRTAYKVFPNATVYTPLIQFSDLLPLQEQQNLEELNEYIDANGYPLMDLNKLLFKVERDMIHWTPSTAQQMFDFWCQQLTY